jgi:hypothetical protein
VICPSCKLGGEINREGNPELATRYHEKCQWPNKGCFCQHAVGDHGYVGS